MRVEKGTPSPAENEKKDNPQFETFSKLNKEGVELQKKTKRKESRGKNAEEREDLLDSEPTKEEKATILNIKEAAEKEAGKWSEQPNEELVFEKKATETILFMEKQNSSKDIGKKIKEIQNFIEKEKNAFEKANIKIDELDEYKKLQDLIPELSVMQADETKKEELRETILRSGTSVKGEPSTLVADKDRPLESGVGGSPLNVYTKNRNPFMQGAEDEIGKDSKADQKKDSSDNATSKKEASVEAAEAKKKEMQEKYPEAARFLEDLEEYLKNDPVAKGIHWDDFLVEKNAFESGDIGPMLDHLLMRLKTAQESELKEADEAEKAKIRTEIERSETILRELGVSVDEKSKTVENTESQRIEKKEVIRKREDTASLEAFKEITKEIEGLYSCYVVIKRKEEISSEQKSLLDKFSLGEDLRKIMAKIAELEEDRTIIKGSLGLTGSGSDYNEMIKTGASSVDYLRNADEALKAAQILEIGINKKLRSLTPEQASTVDKFAKGAGDKVNTEWEDTGGKLSSHYYLNGREVEAIRNGEEIDFSLMKKLLRMTQNEKYIKELRIADARYRITQSKEDSTDPKEDLHKFTIRWSGEWGSKEEKKLEIIVNLNGAEGAGAISGRTLDRKKNRKVGVEAKEFHREKEFWSDSENDERAPFSTDTENETDSEVTSEAISDFGSYEINGKESNTFWKLFLEKNERNQKLALKTLLDGVGGGEYEEIINAKGFKCDSGKDGKGNLYLKVNWTDKAKKDQELNFSIDMKGTNPKLWERMVGKKYDIGVKMEKGGQKADQPNVKKPVDSDQDTVKPEDGSDLKQNEEVTEPEEQKKGDPEKKAEIDKDIKKNYPDTTKFFDFYTEMYGDEDDEGIQEIDKAEGSLKKAEGAAAIKSIETIAAKLDKSLKTEDWSGEEGEVNKQIAEELLKMAKQAVAEVKKKEAAKDKENEQHYDFHLQNGEERSYKVSNEVLEKLKSIATEESSIDDNEAIKELLYALDGRSRNNLSGIEGFYKVEKKKEGESKTRLSFEVIFPGGVKQYATFVIDFSKAKFDSKKDGQEIIVQRRR